MTGPEHYREAERIRSAALYKGTADAEGFTGWTRQELCALAQVHATLALAAATVLSNFPGTADSDTIYGRGTREWAVVTK